jgi:DNA-binding CsgD family transcriptional regulator
MVSQGDREEMPTVSQQKLWQKCLSFNGALNLPIYYFIGLALLEAWSQTIFSSRFSNTLFENSVFVSSLHIYGSLAAILCALLIVALSARWFPLRQHRDALLMFGFLGTLATIGMLAGANGVISDNWALGVNTLIVVSSIWLSLAWYETIASQGVLGMAVCLGCSAVIGSIVSCAIMMLPDTAACVLLGLLPILAALGLRPLSVIADSGRVDRIENHQSVSQQLLCIPLVLLAIIFLIFLPSGALMQIELGVSASSSTASLLIDTLFRIIVMLAAIALYVVGYLLNIVAAFIVSTIFILVASLLMAVGEPFPIDLPHSIVRIGSELVKFLVIWLMIDVAKQHGIPILLPLSVLFAVMYLGILIGQLLLPLTQGNGLLLPLLITSDLVLVAIFILIARSSIEVLTIESKSASDEIDKVFEQFSLSPRENEVLHYWVSGHNSAFIQNQLCLSKHTVKTHIKHIYEKTHTNNKEELIRLLENIR